MYYPYTDLLGSTFVANVVLRWVDIKTSIVRYCVGSLDIDLAHLPKHLNLVRSQSNGHDEIPLLSLESFFKNQNNQLAKS